MLKKSLLAVLLSVSSLTYAQNTDGWITLLNASRFKGDCLEMMCDCVEKDGIGHCCPSGTSTQNAGGNHSTLIPCKCPANQLWDNTLSQCVECLILLSD